MDKIEHVFFDLDHTLWDFEKNSQETLAEIFNLFKLEALTNTSLHNFITRYQHHNTRMWRLYRENRMSKGRLRSARFEAVLADFRVSDKPLAKQIGRYYIEHSPRKTAIHEGTVEILEHLSKRYELHVITNGFEEVQHLKLQCSAIDHYFKNVITSEMARAKKPDPRIFQTALKITGGRPETSIMIGDNYEVDVKGAEAVGWSAIHFVPHYVGDADRTIGKLLELKRILA
ncbi:MAG: YjjG family noncanonical pyrimidine nucleotidase [Salibacteraceae bacterium]